MSGTKICPKCGKELPDDMLICGYCGEKLLVTDQNESTGQVAPDEQVPNKDLEKNTEINSKIEKKRSGVKVIVGMAALIVVAVVAFFAYKNSAPGKYSSAVKAMEGEDYKTASAIFKEVLDHKDSQDLYNQCIYELGKASMKEEKYQEAIDYFNGIAEYEDSKELIKECNHLTDVMNDKEAPIISGLEENISIQCGTPYNVKDYIKEHIQIADNVTTEITDYDVNCDSDAFEQGSGKIDTRDANKFVVEVTSPSTQKNDYGDKMIIYRNIGVEEYWIVDLQKKIVTKYLAKEDFIPETYLHPEAMKVSSYEGLVIDLSEYM